SLSYDPISSSITDYGQEEIITPGALFITSNNETDDTKDGTILAGAEHYTNATSRATSIFFDNSLDTVQKYGYFVTTKIYSDIVGTFSRMVLRADKLKNSGSRIDIKMRTEEKTPTRISITWVDTNTFTTTTDVSGKEGYEVEVLRGT